jgi:hypothetical protein
MTQDGWTADRAFGEMKQYKFERISSTPSSRNSFTPITLSLRSRGVAGHRCSDQGPRANTLLKSQQPEVREGD